MVENDSRFDLDDATTTYQKEKHGYLKHVGRTENEELYIKMEQKVTLVIESHSRRNIFFTEIPF